MGVKWGKKMKNRTIFIALALVCLIGSISMASASQETRLNIKTPALLEFLYIYDDYVLWNNNADDNLHIFNLIAGKETILSGLNSGISMCCNNIVWDDEETINLYNVNTKKNIILFEGRSPSIYGNIITYIGASGIYTYDLSTKKRSLIIPSVTAECPQIYGNNVVYVNNNQVYLYNIKTKQQSLVGPGSYYPNIYGNFILWADNGNIYMRDIATQKTTQITTNGISRHPAIYGDKIVWDTASSPSAYLGGDIYMYTNGKTIQITKTNHAGFPSIYGNKIVYIDSRNRNDVNVDEEDLFVYDLASKLCKPVGTITADVTSGTPPVTVFFGYREDGDMPTSYLWNFGDGITSTHSWTATHTYTKKGTYTVTLKVSNNAGSSTITKTKYITVK
jgi:hypothetical protein